ncbi:hypothetical protein G9A89_013905 [Geosiphon pyriformis]|nr:hypothetical protein G9A89_013905 [Geosiphon pyriformis]
MIDELWWCNVSVEVRRSGISFVAVFEFVGADILSEAAADKWVVAVADKLLVSLVDKLAFDILVVNKVSAAS